MEKTKSRAIIILSGGLDSTTLLYKTINQGFDVYALSFDYKQKHGQKELAMAKKTCLKLGVPHKILDLSVLNDVAPSALTRNDINVPEGHYEADNMSVTVVPNRNMTLLALAASFAISHKIRYIFYGAHMGDNAQYADCSPGFVTAMEKAIFACDYSKLQLQAPFIRMDKKDIVKLGLELKVPFEDTWSCYVGGQRPCLKCGTDVERTWAFYENNAKDPLLTSEEWQIAVDYMLKTTKEFKEKDKNDVRNKN